MKSSLVLNSYFFIYKSGEAWENICIAVLKKNSERVDVFETF